MASEPEPPAAQTPMMQQYLAAKQRYAGEILLFRMGDFYEMFFDDAFVASEVLGIALTSRSKEKDAVPMAGIPVRAIDSYLPRLLRAGKRVAICEQVQDPRDAQGLIEREVVRIISPGTITDERIIGERSHNYLVSLLSASNAYGLAWVDVSTGLFQLWESPSSAAVVSEISRLAPSEFVLPESLSFEIAKRPELSAVVAGTFQSPYPDAQFEKESAYRTLVEHFRTKTLEGFGCEHLGLGIRAAGGLLSYLKDTQKVPLKHLTRVQPFQSGKVMPIDRATRRALEITETLREGERSGTLLASLDHTLTAAGGRKLRDWLLAPLTDVDAIVERQSGVAELVEQKALRETLSDLLRRVHDVERICTRISYGSASPRDLVALARSLEVVPGVHAALAACRSPVLAATSRRLGELPELRDELTRALVPEPPLSPREGGLLRQGYNAELDELREVAREGSHWFARFQEKEVERSGIPSLKVGYNRIFGYYIEVTNPHRDKVPADYVRKQTLKNCERYINADLKDYESKVLNAREAAMDLEYKVFLSLRGAAEAEIAQLQENAAALAELDVLDAFARLAHERRYVRPEVNGSSRLFIEDGRHPVVEEVATTEPFIPNSVDLGEEARIMIITGPNMAGKSTYIRQVALLTLLAQVGCFIPAKRAEIGIADRIFTRVGSGDDLTRGQSTFMVEMSETANILNNATSRSLVVLDEVGRGTSTYDGLSLAWSITEHIAEHIGARTLFATHYHELTALSTSYAGVRNFNFAVKEWNEDIIFLRKLIEGGADKSYGIHVARLAGIPDGVLDRAKEVLANLENQSRDVHDQPALARRRRRPAPSAAAGSRTLQLDLFHNINDEVLKEIQALAIDGMTPLEALQYLAGLKKRIV